MIQDTIVNTAPILGPFVGGAVGAVAGAMATGVGSDFAVRGSWFRRTGTVYSANEQQLLLYKA